MSTVLRKPPLEPEYASAREIAARGGPSESFLAKARMTGANNGPPFIKVGAMVRYHLPRFRQWMAERERKPHQSGGSQAKPRRGLDHRAGADVGTPQAMESDVTSLAELNAASQSG
jgi:hypothetical protein